MIIGLAVKLGRRHTDIAQQLGSAESESISDLLQTKKCSVLNIVGALSIVPTAYFGITGLFAIKENISPAHAPYQAGHWKKDIPNELKLQANELVEGPDQRDGKDWQHARYLVPASVRYANREITKNNIAPEIESALSNPAVIHHAINTYMNQLMAFGEKTYPEIVIDFRRLQQQGRVKFVDTLGAPMALWQPLSGTLTLAKDKFFNGKNGECLSTIAHELTHSKTEASTYLGDSFDLVSKITQKMAGLFNPNYETAAAEGLYQVSPPEVMAYRTEVEMTKSLTPNAPKQQAKSANVIINGKPFRKGSDGQLHLVRNNSLTIKTTQRDNSPSMDNLKLTPELVTSLERGDPAPGILGNPLKMETMAASILLAIGSMLTTVRFVKRQMRTPRKEPITAKAPVLPTIMQKLQERIGASLVAYKSKNSPVTPAE